MADTTPRADRYSGGEIGLGLLAAFALLGLCALLAWYSDVARMWKTRQVIHVVFESVGDLTRNAPVRYNGIEVGRVKALNPLHLDEKILAENFRPFVVSDLNNLPLRGEKENKVLRQLPKEQFDAECKKRLVGCTMVELVLEVLAENDPIRYREDDEVRIVSSIFPNDASVEIISSNGPVIDSKKRQFVLGTSGDFIGNLQRGMREALLILNGTLDTFGAGERQAVANIQKRFKPATATVAELRKTMSERVDKTIRHFNEVRDRANTTLDSTRMLLEGLRPSATETAQNVQDSIKDLKEKFQAARDEASASMQEISTEARDVNAGIQAPWNELREGFEGVRLPLANAKDRAERAPYRLDTASDTAGSMQSQSEADLDRFAVALPKIILNLKITGYVAKENKDLMVGNSDKGEYVEATAQDIQRKVAMAARRWREAGADAAEAAAAIQNEFAAEPVLQHADQTVRALAATRSSLDTLRDELDARYAPPWTRRKRAAWSGDGPIRWQEN